ncbi:hypothetical protein CDAR_530751 [Caerostris darwini]|uniref:Uncharacterized protein n=1 Tax=Caerostris darwini TaxID=1538125 RepID=A0AAV4NVV5_9ARAC|nr:hypothetical protein CDAR_530751 [Caerostris darwini]
MNCTHLTRLPPRTSSPLCEGQSKLPSCSTLRYRELYSPDKATSKNIFTQLMKVNPIRDVPCELLLTWTWLPPKNIFPN